MLLCSGCAKLVATHLFLKSFQLRPHLQAMPHIFTSPRSASRPSADSSACPPCGWAAGGTALRLPQRKCHVKCCMCDYQIKMQSINAIMGIPFSPAHFIYILRFFLHKRYLMFSIYIVNNNAIMLFSEAFHFTKGRCRG